MEAPNGLRRMRLMIVAAGLFYCVACTTTTTTFAPARSARSYTPNSGKVIVLATPADPGSAVPKAWQSDVPGAEEIGTIQVQTNSPWMSNEEFVSHWKKEAAARGANAVRWSGAGNDRGKGNFWPKYYTSATAYRLPNINDPAIKDHTASPCAKYHD